MSEEVLELTDTSASGSAVENADNMSEENKPVDFYQPRTVVLTNKIKGKEVEFTHKITRLTDKIWLDFNDTLNPRRVLESKKFVYREQRKEAVKEAYKALVATIPEGYQPFFKQTLTLENFHGLIPYNDQNEIVERVFAFDINESESDEFFFDSDGATRFEIDAPIGGETATGVVALSGKSKRSENDYKAAVKEKGADAKRFRSVEISLKSDFEKLSELFFSLNAGAENFSGGIPVWIQVGLMTYYFTQFGVSEIKND